MKWFFRIFLFLGIAFLLLISGVTIYLQTPIGKNQLTDYANSFLEKKDVTVEFKRVGGLLPFRWTVYGAFIRISPTQSLYFDKVIIRPYFWRFLTNEVAFHSIKAEGGSFIDNNPKPTLDSITPDFPFHLYVKHFAIQNMSVKLYDKPTYQFDMKGSLRVHAYGEKTFLSLTLKEKATQESSFDLTFQGEKDKLAFVNVDSGLKIKEFFPDSSVDGLALFSAFFAGSWEAFDALFTKQNLRLPIQGTVEGNLYYFQHKDYIFPYPLQLNSNFTLYSNKELDIAFYEVETPLGKVHGKGNFSADLTLNELTVSGRMQPPPSKYWDGPLFLEGTLKGEKEFIAYSANFHSPLGQLWIWPFEGTSLDVKGRYKDFVIDGELSSLFTIYSKQWKSTFSFTGFVKEQNLFLHNVRLYSPFSAIEGDIGWQENRLLGKLFLKVDDLSQIQPFFPTITAFGSMYGDIILSDYNGQSVNMDLGFFDTIYEGLHAQKGSLTVEGNDLFTDPYFEIIAHVDEARYRGLQLDNFYFSTQIKDENWPFSLSMEGESINPIDMLIDGFWKMHSNNLFINIQTFDGYIFGQPFILSNPFHLEYNDKLFEVTPFTLQMPDSTLQASCLFSEERSSLILKSDLFPLSFLSLNPWNLSVGGSAMIDFELTQEKKRAPFMKFRSTIDEMMVIDQADQNPIHGSGTIDASLERGSFAFDGKFKIREDENIALNLLLPVDIKLYPFSLYTHPYGNLRGNLAFHAKVQDFLDYINIGPHRLEGDLDCDLSLAGLWRKPTFTGKALFQNGNYENYYTGTVFEDLTASFSFHQQELFMTSLKGKDLDEGILSGSGKMTLSTKRYFPFQAEVEFDDLILVNIDLVQGKANGVTTISGNTKGALAKGNVEVSKANFNIPDRLSFPIPSLPVTFVNRTTSPFHKEEIDLYQRSPYPLKLDFNVSAPKDVYIKGRGLTSEWKGTFHIGGTYDDILAKGDLELVKGDFLFGGKTFKLTTGLFAFSGESNVPPYFEISGKVEQSGITIIASLKGKLTSPRLTFRSLPPHPVSAILSYLIFGQDISEISPIQAAQLAATAATLAGEGPDILELTRKSLGLDRLAVISTPSKEGVEGAALQVGKYLTKGVLFSVSQGTDPSSGNLNIEVDLTHGFIFEAETLQQQEQGKFSLKWHKNY